MRLADAETRIRILLNHFKNRCTLISTRTFTVKNLHGRSSQLLMIAARLQTHDGLNA
jgi:hypothetical protein